MPTTGSRGAPSLRAERALLRGGAQVVAGMDEVGRGSLAGPVSVGVVLVDLRTRTAPAGLRDSKLLSPAERERLEPRVLRWGLGCAVGHAEAAEVDAYGILAALRLAGRRALSQIPVTADVVLLDGSYDWLTRSPPTLFEPPTDRADPPVVTKVKADMSCASVAAASVLAKLNRDGLMVDLARLHPEYGWDGNKGYASPEHRDALVVHGASPLHRCTWRLGVTEGIAEALASRH